MKNTFYIAFDDTDNLGSPGTGHILTGFLEESGIEYDFISRHQLYFSPDVPYTSHNSTMCAKISTEISYEDVIKKASEYLKKVLADGSDPGLCVANPAKIQAFEMLVAWGYDAKKKVLSKDLAYELAEKCQVHLSEHGGIGQGVVGALAGVALRLAGNDGRVKGKKNVAPGAYTVKELLEMTGFQRVCAYACGELQDDAVVRVKDSKVKAVYQNFKSTILAKPSADGYEVLMKNEIKCY